MQDKQLLDNNLNQIVSYKYDSWGTPISIKDANGNFAWTAVLPWTIPGFTKVLEALVGTGAGVVIGGTIWENIKPKEKAESKSEVVPKEQSKPKTPQYWAADNNAKQGVELTYKEAQLRIAQGENIICKNQASAFEIAKWFPESYLEGPHGGEGYYPHYHINKKHGAPHIWFYPDP